MIDLIQTCPSKKAFETLLKLSNDEMHGVDRALLFFFQSNHLVSTASPAENEKQ